MDEAKPSMGGEDFSEYGLAGVPICMFRLGAVDQARLDEFAARKDEPPPSLHSPLYYPNAEAALRVGVPAMVAVAEDLVAAARHGKRRESEPDGGSRQVWPLAVVVGRRLRGAAGRRRVVDLRGPRLGPGRI